MYVVSQLLIVASPSIDTEKLEFRLSQFVCKKFVNIPKSFFFFIIAASFFVSSSCSAADEIECRISRTSVFWGKAKGFDGACDVI